MRHNPWCVRDRRFRAGRIAAGSCLAAALAVAGCTHTPWQPTRGWSASKTENVTVYTDTLLEHRFSQEWLELAFAAYHAFLPSVPARPVEVLYLVNEPGALGRFYWPNDDPPHAWTLETMPGTGRIGRDGLIVLETREPMDASLQLAFHFVGRALPHAPLWVQVGLARYMSNHRIHYKDDHWVACFGSTGFPAVPGANPRNVLMPVYEMFTVDWYAYNDSARHWFSYTAYAMIHYLVHGERNYHAKRFPIFMQALAEGKTTEDALALAYPHILSDEWDQRLIDYTHGPRKYQRLGQNRALPQGMCYDIPPVTAADKTPQRTPVSEQDIRAVMRDLERVDVFHAHAPYLPADVVSAEAAKRPLHREGAPPSEGVAPDGKTPVLRSDPEGQ